MKSQVSWHSFYVDLRKDPLVMQQNNEHLEVEQSHCLQFHSQSSPRNCQSDRSTQWVLRTGWVDPNGWGKKFCPPKPNPNPHPNPWVWWRGFRSEKTSHSMQIFRCGMQIFLSQVWHANYFYIYYAIEFWLLFTKHTTYKFLSPHAKQLLQAQTDYHMSTWPQFCSRCHNQSIGLNLKFACCAWKYDP